MKRYHKMMEVFWLISSFITAFFATYAVSKVGFKEGYMYLGMPVLTVAMYSLRRYMRKKMEKKEMEK